MNALARSDAPAPPGRETSGHDAAAALGAAAGPQTLLRFLTCGSVDDGKSTLIGRLLYECGAVFEDQLVALDRDSKKFGTDGDNLDFALLVDGLTAEREQGITIDVAYRYFSTPRRAFIVADTPGHEQYTRNMATGASTADVAILLIDARKGVLRQTRRHAFIASMLRVRHIVLAINKMDLVDYDRAVFDRIRADFSAIARDLDFASVTPIPLSARKGDNVAKPSQAMGWYDGPTLLSHLEAIDVGGADATAAGFLFPVQWVNRPDQHFRGFSGTIASGVVRPGDEVVIAPDGLGGRVARVVSADGDLDEARAGQAVTLTLTSEIDVSRGDVLLSAPSVAQAQRSFIAHVFWTSAAPASQGARYILKLASAQTPVELSTLHHVIDIESYAPQTAPSIAMNGFGLVTLTLDRAVVLADYRADRMLGGFILIDRFSNETVAIGLVDNVANIHAARAPTPTTSGLAALQARALRMFERRAGVAGSQQRNDFWRATSWRIAGAALVGLAAGAATFSVLTGVAFAIGDGVLRGPLRRLHDAIWRRLRPAADEINDGGSGI